MTPWNTPIPLHSLRGLLSLHCVGWRVLLMVLFVYGTPTVALSKLKASTNADLLHPQDDGVVLPYWLTRYQCNRNSFNGETGIVLGNEAGPIWVYALGRAVPVGQATLRHTSVVKIWDELAETILASVEVGPNSAIQNGYAMESLSSALYLPVGDYRLSQNTWRGMDPWPDSYHAPARGADASSLLTFRGACYARRAGEYPSQTFAFTKGAGMLQLNFARAKVCRKSIPNGWYEGTYDDVLAPSDSPNGNVWTWTQCAAKCAESSKCEFWTLQLNGAQSCMLMSNRGIYHDTGGHYSGVKMAVCAEATTASATYVIGGGYRAASGRSAEASCGAAGHQDITTLHECQSAAKQVGIAITETVGPGTWHQVPYGCTVQQGTATPESGAVGTKGRVHFSTTPGDNNGGMGGYVLICKQAAVVSDAPTVRIAVFSAQFGGRDRIQYRLGKDAFVEELEDEGFNRWTESSDQIGEQLPDGVDAFLFTDMINVERKEDSPWQFIFARQFEELCDDNVLCLWNHTNLTRSQKSMQRILASKFFKIRWVAENTHYDYIVWMDGKYLLRNPMLTETIEKYMGDSIDMLVMRHPTRNSVAEELGPASQRAAQILADDSVVQQADANYKRYKHEGFFDTTGLFDSSMYIVRPARVRDMFIDWWHEVQQGVPRDQISLSWMIQKHGINVYSIGRFPCAILGENCQNPHAHKR